MNVCSINPKALLHAKERGRPELGRILGACFCTSVLCLRLARLIEIPQKNDTRIGSEVRFLSGRSDTKRSDSELQFVLIIRESKLLSGV